MPQRPRSPFTYIVYPENDCWIWQRSLSGYGYGQVRIDGKIYYAHVLAWEEVNGPKPEGYKVHHKCNNRSCVNPDHLELVTHAVNIQYAKQDRGGLRFSVEEIIELRGRRAAGETCSALAAAYGVHLRTIYRITRRETWSHI